MINCSSSIYNTKEIEKKYSQLQKDYGINIIEV